MHPESITPRFERAGKGRKITITELGDGMVKLEAIIAAAPGRGIHDRLTQQAREVRRAAADHELERAQQDADAAPPEVIDTRTTDQVRADIFCDLLLPGQPALHPTPDTMPGRLGPLLAQHQGTVHRPPAAGEGERGA